MSAELKMTREFNAPVEAVYAAWTDPEQLPQWMGPGSVVCVKFDSDLRVGGLYEIHMQTDQGIKIAYGEYKEIEKNQKLSFSWGWRDSEDVTDSLVTLTFSKSENGTQLTLEHTNLPTSESARHHTMGWEGSLDKLLTYLLSA